MKDELENFISKNRAAFDDRDVPPRAWTTIRRALTFRSPSLWNSVGIWRAAAILFMLSTGYFLVSTTIGNRDDKQLKLAGVKTLNEFHDVEEFYTQEISEKVKLIDNFQQRDGLNGFTHDFHQLEAMYMVLKEEMRNSPSEKVKDALVLNLLVRIDLLNQQLHKLEHQQRKDKKSESEGRSA